MQTFTFILHNLLLQVTYFNTLSMSQEHSLAFFFTKILLLITVSEIVKLDEI